MKIILFKICFIVGFTFVPLMSYAQSLTATDRSEKTVLRYKNVIANNKEIVEFIEYSLVTNGLPKHLKNLALIESGFNRNAISSAGAKGVWQFMEGHALDHGLSGQDRDDIVKSTNVAMVSLKKLYRKYGNWVTVVAAYNCGEGNVQKAIDKAGSSRYVDFYAYLPSETINHVKKYLNASYATGELEEVLRDYELSLGSKKFKPKSKLDENLLAVGINSAYKIEVVAKYLNIEKSQIIKWNNNIEEELENLGETDLYLPYDLMTAFTLNQTQILEESLRKL